MSNSDLGSTVAGSLDTEATQIPNYTEKRKSPKHNNLLLKNCREDKITHSVEAKRRCADKPEVILRQNLVSAH